MDLAKIPFTQDDMGQLSLPSDKLAQAAQAEFLSTRSFVYTTRLILRDEISPASLYLYLLARFQSPNGVMSAIRRHDDRARRSLNWHYTLEWRGRLIHFVCYHHRMDVLFSPGQEVDLTSEGLAELIREGLRRHAKQVQAARQQVERYKTFLNPLSHLKDAIQRLLAKAEDLDESLVKSRPHPETIEDIKWLVEHHEKNSIRASELSGCCLSIRMMSPVFAEMFVNLLIFNLYPNVPGREQKMAEFRRASILTRISQLAQVCDGFASKPDDQASEMREFKGLMDRRNDLLHGNIKPEDKIEGDFQVHDGVATPCKFKPIYERALRPTLNAFPIEEARRDSRVAWSFIQYLLSCLDDRRRAELEPMLESMDLHYNAKTKKVCVLYGNEFHESVDPELLQGLDKLPDWLA